MTDKKKADARTLKWILFLAVGGILFLPCTGIVAAIAIPQFIKYLTNAKTSEAESNLRSLYQGAAAYYEQPHVGADGQVRTHCLVDHDTTPGVPGPTQVLHGPLGPSFEALGFHAAEPLYYRYEIVSVGGCGHPGGAHSLYTFRAQGDLDGDTRLSTYEIAAGSSEQNVLRRAPNIYVEAPLE